jgi:hypothetical protein
MSNKTMKKFLIILMSAALLVSCFHTRENKQRSTLLAKQDAIKIATNDAGGFLGTWIDADLKYGDWHISAHSKSVNPPTYYVINGRTGVIKMKLGNIDDPNQRKQLIEFMKNASNN